MFIEKINMKQFFIVILFIIFATGCANIKSMPQLASKQEDIRLKSFEAPKKNAIIYIYRNEIRGNIAIMDVKVDGEFLGETVWKTYLYKEVTPGTHIITSKAANEHSIEIDVKAGSVNYIWQEVKLGILSPRSKLHLVSSAEGKAGVLESKLIVTK